MSHQQTPGEPQLLVHARRYATMLASENARSNFLLRLQLCSDTDLLRQLAREHALTPEIVVPVWMRLENIAPQDISILVEAAGVYYSFGYDEEALYRLEQTFAVNPDYIPALELKAALTPDPHQRRLVYEQILKLEPGNRRAVDHLIVLERTGR